MAMHGTARRDTRRGPEETVAIVRQPCMLTLVTVIHAPRVVHVLIQFSDGRERTQEDPHETRNHERVVGFHPEERLAGGRLSRYTRFLSCSGWDATNLQIERIEFGR